MIPFVPGMGDAWRVEPLHRSHDKSRFDCGNPVLNEWLMKYAGQSQKAGIARTFVALSGKVGDHSVQGFHSLSAGGIDKSHLPAHAGKRFPKFPIPIIRLARLAVAKESQGHGLGELILMDALHRSLQVSRQVGFVAVLVDAKDEAARNFYLHYEFEKLPDQPMTLWLPITGVEKLF
ncbi:GNAT family N-acetyltransferase [Acidithiobacillus ferriphilus]|nr:GNAT family N-acetyltransferase [Acidithiobacillus ferriphilus]MBU2849337.1 GNAT family N-acetyltransferase [Acidithiobacillus ferriphilus]